MKYDYSQSDIFGSYSAADQIIGELLKEDEKIPSEKNPFCNETEISSYNEDYSLIVPDRFFSDTRCSLKPSAAEKKRLRYYYNLSGILLISGFMIFFSVFVFSILSALTLSYSAMMSDHSFGYVLKNTTVLYSSLTIASAVTVPLICAAGIKFSGLTLSGLFKSNHNIKTGEIICCIMTGIFLASAGEAVSMLVSYFTPYTFEHSVKFTDNIYQIIIVSVFKCIVVPIAQGLIFRGIVLKNLSRAGQKFGICSASFLCALSSFSAVNIIPAFFFSVMLSKITVKYNTLVPGIAVHIVINSCSLLINLYSDLAMGSDPLVTRLWTIITLLAGSVFAAYFMLKERLPKLLPEQRRRTLPLYITSPAVIIAFLIMAAITAADTIIFVL